MLIVAAFLGKTHYKSALSALGSYKDRIALDMKNYPNQSPRKTYGTFKKLAKQTPAQLKAEKLKALNEIAAKALEDKKAPAPTKRWHARSIDCFLYAQDDQYK